MANTKIIDKFQQASDGLFMPSESDYPFEPFIWSGQAQEPLNTQKLLELTNHPQNSPVETVELSHLFRNLAYEQDWHDEQQKENVSKYRQLLEVLESNLKDIQAYRVGTISIDVYIVGKTEEGDLAGLKTTVVET